ncbi:MAG: hypothetical protein HY999_00125 [Nitrospinae bacterium]|nr:hypothetical protein [Nitrospinota bacterium]
MDKFGERAEVRGYFQGNMLIIEEIKNIKCGREELRKFGITIGIVLGVLGGVFLWRDKDYYPYLFILSILFLFLGLVLPILLKPIYKIWMSLAIMMGLFMTGVILSLLFYLVFTSIGVISRLFGKEFLDLKIDRSQESYWKYKESKGFKQSDYERQF